MKWIKANEQLPNASNWYLVVEEGCDSSIAYYSLEAREPYWHNECYEPKVIYWMPLPKAPEENKVILCEHYTCFYKEDDGLIGAKIIACKECIAAITATLAELGKE